MFSWDQKIARAKKLSAGDSPARGILHVYMQVTAFQKNLSAGLNGTEHSDVRSLLRFLPELKKLVTSLNSPPLQAVVAELADDSDRWSNLLLKHWEQDSGQDSPAQAFLAYTLLQPYAQHVTARMNTPPDSSWAQCPACGNPPLLSLLREFNNGSRRSLLCVLCSTEWDFLRVLCPNCGEKHNEKLPVFTAEEFQQARVEACDSCKTYIKCIDLSKDGHAVPHVDDLATLALDVWAEQQGYERQQPNMFLLASN